MAIIYGGTSYLGTIQPAYNPITFLVQDDGTSGLGGTPPVVYCDIYFDSLYYKTITSTSPFNVVGLTSFWLFDIAGICQEYIRTRIPDVTSNNYQQTYGSSNYYGATLCFVKFRISTVDLFGVITPGGTAPIQGTVDSAPVSGSGWVTDTFMVVNAALQVTDIMDLENMLKAFRQTGTFLGGIYPQNVDTHYRVYALSYLKNGKTFANDYGQLAIICCRQGYLGLSFVNASITLMVQDPSGALVYMNNLAAVTIGDLSVYYLPVGIKNLAAMFPTAIPYLVGGNTYFVGIFDPVYVSVFKFVYVSPKYFIQYRDGTELPIQPLTQKAATPKHSRIWFQNYLGHFDQINFIEREETLKVTTMPTETPLNSLIGYSSTGSIGQWQSGRSLPSMTRNNVRSNENNVVTGRFLESDMPMLKQLMSSAKTYIEFLSPENTDLIPPVALLLPIKIIDDEYLTQKFEDRFEYRVSIKYVMSYENRTIRN